MAKKRVLVTSALPYVNNVPHLGNIIGCVLSADVYARFQRSIGNDVLFVCGTDEHGTTTEAKAIEEGLSPKEICDKYHKIHKEIYGWFNCSFDCFGRTSTKEHAELTQGIFKKLYDNGYIKEGVVEQAYCKKCERFLADRFIEGDCPFCNSTGCRGDQCEACGKLLEPTQLINPKCKLCGSTPEIRESRHLFLNLPMLEPKLKKWFNEQHKKSVWSQNAIDATNTWLKEGLKERCITRDLKWGVPVPLKGFENKVFYVWFDAPIGYISITKACKKNIDSWWKNKDVRLVQFMGKDNIIFHTILFPASLMGANDNYTLVDSISATEYLNYETGKFSKSRGEGVFGDDAIKTGIPADVWRYYLLTNRPENGDTIFSWHDFQDKTNKELLANLGNFVNRTLTFIDARFSGKIPKYSPNEQDKKFIAEVSAKTTEVAELLEKIRLKDALREAMTISKLCNAYFQENEPWKTITTDIKRCETAVGICANMVAKLAIIFEPFLPETASRIFKQLNIPPLDWQHINDFELEPGHKIGKPRPLFSKIEDAELEKLKKQFSGKKIIAEEPFAKLNLKVAKVVEAKQHPNADKLIVMQVSLGEEKRSIVAGIREHYKPEELVGKKIVIVSNLKPAKLRGVESNGMLLAAEKNGKVRILEAQKSEPGSQVFVEGIPAGQAEITIDDFAKVELKTKNKKAVYLDLPLRTEKEEIKADIEDGAKIR